MYMFSIFNIDLSFFIATKCNWLVDEIRSTLEDQA